MELGKEAGRNRMLFFAGEDVRKIVNSIELELALAETPADAEAIHTRVEEWTKEFDRLSQYSLALADTLNELPATQTA